MPAFGNFKWNIEAFREVRNSEGVTELFHKNGEEWVQRLNDELHQAQSKRGQPIEDGYAYDITHGDRARLHIYPFTARAMAHEARHQSMLKEMQMGAKVVESAVDLDVPQELAERANEARIQLDVQTGKNRSRAARRASRKRGKK